MRSLIITLVHFFFLTNIGTAQNQNMVFQSQLSYEVDLSDIWGYTDDIGRDFAIVGLFNGTSFVDISIPNSPREVARVPGGLSSWKDIKTYKDRAFIVGEYPQGLQIIDLSRLPNELDSTDQFFWDTVTPFGRIRNCHNLFIEESTGIGYLSGCASNVPGGVIMIDVKPEIPVYLGRTNNGYSHDVYVRNDTIYSSDINDGVFSIIDASNKTAPNILASQSTPQRLTHNSWLSDDGNTIFTTDEVGNASVAAYDITDLDNIRLLDEFRPRGTISSGLIPHNVHVRNDFLISSFYAEGVIITDASRPDNLVQIGNYDTFFGANSSFLGAWGAFPFFESDIVIVSDITNGLFVLEANYVRASFFEGMVRDSSTGEPLGGVFIEGFDRGVSVFQASTGLDGTFSVGTVISGNLDIVFRKTDFATRQVNIDLNNGQVTNIDLNLLPTGISLIGDNLIGCAPHVVNFSTIGATTDNFQWTFEGLSLIHISEPTRPY